MTTEVAPTRELADRRASTPRHRPAPGLGALLCLVSATGFGLSAVFAKQSYAAGISVPAMLAGRFAVAAAVLWVVVAFRRPAFPTLRTLLTCIGLGGIGYASQALLYFGALSWIDASLTGLLLYLYPALVTGLAVLLRRESPDRRRYAALLCSAVGLVLILGSGGAIGSAAGIGVALALGAAAAYALYLTVAAGVPTELDVFLLSAIVCTSACVTMTIAGYATGSMAAPGDVTGWGWVVLLAIFSTVVPIATLLAGIRLVGASTASILSCAEPAVTVASTALVYGERLTPGQLVGGVIVLAAVLVLQVPIRRGGSRNRHAE
ncbi:MAG: DMT family transporter [Hamadaea sp.]|uniref:DMT family transporter n=1 Tax=Hamadaea sp. TaxID=2024425 RepID=UPI001853C8E8|nr:DMT family transporter [Hamadaea sp.]NUT17930.1 DMT family transporter [Hamadaea sp.]